VFVNPLHLDRQTTKFLEFFVMTRAWDSNPWDRMIGIFCPIMTELNMQRHLLSIFEVCFVDDWSGKVDHVASTAPVDTAFDWLVVLEKDIDRTSNTETVYRAFPAIPRNPLTILIDMGHCGSLPV
jgi:hypothetical protein